MYKRNILLAITYLLLTTNSAIARPWYSESQVNSTVGYDDNPALEVSEDMDSMDDSSQFDTIGEQSFVSVGGGMRFGSETESDLIAIDLSATARRYNESVLNSEYASAIAQYQKNGIKHDYGFEAGISTDSTLETELEDTGRLESDVDRDERFILSTLTTRFTSLLIGEFELGYHDFKFDESDGTTDTFVDFEDFFVSAQLNRIVTERFRVFGLVDYLIYKPTEDIALGETERDTVNSIQLGVNYSLSEPISVSFSAGRAFTETDQSGIGETFSFSSNNTIYNLGFNYTGDRNTGEISFANTFESSADGGLSETQSVTLGFSRPETLGGTLIIPGSYVKRDPVRGETESREYYELAPRINWQVSQNFSVSSEIRYREQRLTDTSLDTEDQASSTAVLVEVRYDFGRKQISY